MSSVLIVDDDPGTLEGFQRILHSEGYEVLTADTATNALALARNNRVALALVDLRLPDMSGTDLIGQLRAMDSQSFPVVVITGFGTVPSAIEAIRLGALNYLEKPIFADVLVDVVRAAVSNNASGPAYDAIHEQVVDPRVRRVLAIIMSRYEDTHLSSRSVARELGLSHEHLCRLIKLAVGKSFMKILDDTRAREARRLVMESRLRAKEIAAAVGYEDTSRLDRHFKRHFGVTPIALRRSAPETRD